MRNPNNPCIFCFTKKKDYQFENKTDDVYGFQFHPESFLTTNGKILIKKILQSKRS